jgi:hypothetical protein
VERCYFEKNPTSATVVIRARLDIGDPRRQPDGKHMNDRLCMRYPWVVYAIEAPSEKSPVSDVLIIYIEVLYAISSVHQACNGCHVEKCSVEAWGTVINVILCPQSLLRQHASTLN